MALISIVEWNKDLDPSYVFAWRYVDPKNPRDSENIGNWTQLIVQESQEAVLFKDGQALDLFGPGRHTLSTDNIPLLSRIINLPTGGKTPFKASVWFLNKLNVLDVKWGTSSPLLLKDPEFHIPVPVRAYGQFGIRVKDSRKFLIKLVGTNSQLTRDDLVNAFRGVILSRIGDMIATYIVEKKITIFDISVYLRDMSDEAVEEIRPVFEEYGIEPANFFIGSINVPEDDPAVADLRKALSERARMNVMGYSYQQQRSFDTMEAMAQSSGEGGGGNPLLGAGMGMGAGLGMGGVFAQMASQMGQNVNLNAPQSQASQTDSPVQSVVPCPKCQKDVPQGTRFCPHCGNAMVPLCANCKTPLGDGARFCPKCGHEVQKSCSCGEPLPKGALFCPKCGQKAEQA
ncbi:MAG: SPFH domain-containing protein [Fretibacterium sp.]|nr:SPFH domain-containing protein [Fretibacterium sp.]